MSDTLKQNLEQQRTSLKRDYESNLSLWRDLADNFLPMRGRFLNDKPNQGRRRNLKIINETPILASRTFGAGMVSGASSQSRPWFRLTTSDPDVMEDEGVKEWLYSVERRMRDVFSRSNFYASLRPCYTEYGVFGTLALGMFDDPQKVLHTSAYTVGGYSISNNDKGVIDTFMQDFKWTVRQVVDKFVKEKDKSGNPKADAKSWDRISKEVKQAWDRRQREQWVDVVYAVQPNDMQDAIRADFRGMPFSSIYYERDNPSNDQLLSESGYREFPIMVARLSRNEGDAYGTGLAVDCLGSAKALQLQEKRKAQVIDKEVDPPMVGHPSLRNQPASQLPGDITFVEIGQGQVGFQPAHVWKPDRSGMLEDIGAIESRINRVMFSDIFTLFIQGEQGNETATEAAIKNQERLQMMGPVLEGANGELLGPAIERLFSMMMRRGLIPDPPQALDAQQLKVEYISILAQAQNLAAVQGINQFTGFVTQLAAQQASMQQEPTALDKLDIDQAIDEYGALSGVVPTLIRSDDDVAALRDQRAKQQQAQQQAQAAAAMIPAGAKAAKDLSQTKLGEGSALDALAQ